MKKFFMVFLLLFLFIFVNNYSYAQSTLQSLENISPASHTSSQSLEVQKIWWSSLFPSYRMTNLDSSVDFQDNLEEKDSKNSPTKASKTQLKFKIIELFR